MWDSRKAKKIKKQVIKNNSNCQFRNVLNEGK